MKTKLQRHIYYFILGVLGFAVAICIKDPEPIMVMYGVLPPINAKISGKVTDKNNKPINGIKVQSGYSQQTFTASDGRYEISEDGYMTQFLVFTDIDGVENGGEFVERSVKVEFTEADRTGEDSFERKNVNVELEEVSD
jgi:putative lipoprotein (rSAM/lipoprotein system)